VIDAANAAERITDYDLVVTSPGLPPTAPVLAAAAAAVQAKTGAEIAMMANAIGGRPTAAATDAEEKKAWEEGMAMLVDEAVRYALTRNS